MWTLMGKFQYFSVSFDRGRNVNANPLQSECNARKADWNVKTQQHACLLQLFALFSLWSWDFQLRCKKYDFDFDTTAKLEMVNNMHEFSWGGFICTFSLSISQFQLHCELVSSLLALDATELVFQPLTQMVVEMINIHVISVQQKR